MENKQYERTIARTFSRELTNEELEHISGGVRRPEGTSMVTCSAGGEDDCGQD
jgi:bacteriocin-like protein